MTCAGVPLLDTPDADRDEPPNDTDADADLGNQQVRLDVDVKQWDRSDFFHVDRNPNILLVTERVASVIEEHGFTNIVAQPNKVRQT